MESPRILITGGRGFIGTALKRWAPPRVRIISVDRVAPDPDAANRVEIQCDITDMEGMRSLCRELRPTHVVHLAAISSVGECEADEREAYRTNVEGSEVVTRLCLEVPTVVRLVFASSSMVLGHFSNSIVTEDEAVKPVSVYGKTKLTAERRIAELLTANEGPDYVILRLMAVYGPGDKRRRVVSAVADQLFHDRPALVCGCANRVAFTYVDDVCRALGSAIEYGGTLRTVLHFAYDGCWTLYEMARTIAAAVGRGTIDVRNDGCKCVRRGRYNTARAIAALECRPTVGLEEGVALLLAGDYGQGESVESNRPVL